MVENLNIEDIKHDLNHLYNDLSRNKSKNSEIIQKTILKLEKILLNNKFTKLQEREIINSFKKNLSQFQFYYEIFETNLEIEFTNSAIESNEFYLKDLEKYLLYTRFVTLVKNEINLGKISENDYVLFIGSGPLPITAILLNVFVKCKVDCYDEKKEYVGISRKVIEKLGLSNDIKIYNKQGQSLNDSSYTAIIVTLLAKPKDKILERVWDKTLPDTRIICRTSDGIRQLFYEQTNINLLNLYNPIDKIYAVEDQTISSVLLRK